MKIKVQTRKLAASCSKHCFKVVDGTDEVSSKHCLSDVVSHHTYGKAKLTWFEEIFKEYKTEKSKFDSYLDSSQALIFYSLQ
ncbi:hypothetical protein [Streptococcus pneumoniae]|uniref:hypothetical protein n=1 Tax=Streptococcus pneumoniae TaxID=1313 RepID=UPI00067CB2CD|nr:hypothetical protein [Streptococcus pneumoniae]